MAKKPSVKLPLKVLGPVKKFLSGEEKKLIEKKKELKEEDPFSDSSRLNDNAAVDTEAAEQVDHARVDALKKQVERKLIQIRKAMTRLRLGKYGSCEKCNAMISTDRLMIRPEATTCIKCERRKSS
ncbi:TraR/DksA family transcriptional regulator [Patescibacteria group bacterium]